GRGRLFVVRELPQELAAERRRLAKLPAGEKRGELAALGLTRVVVKLGRGAERGGRLIRPGEPVEDMPAMQVEFRVIGHRADRRVDRVERRRRPVALDLDTGEDAQRDRIAGPG